MKFSRLLFLLLLSTKIASAQTSKVFDQLSLPSKLLKSERKFAIYLPPDYATSERSYPVLYLLHGAGDDQTGWVQFGMVQHIADKAIADGSAAPMIIVMPDANTGRRGYFNDVKGDWPYEDFFFKELIPFIEKKYRVKAEKEFRAVAGLSMGGGGTFMYALHHPELFAAACPLSASTGPITLEDARKNLERNNPGVADTTVARYYERHSALALINNMPDNQKKAVKWYIDCGDDDFLYEGNSLVHIALRKKEVPHEFRIREGAHNWKYWRESLPNVLEFVSQSFHR
ncbi:alpha/beta hydrolase [Dyadobacter sp.]|uniref:alpha/beta hydrolase n=1 Tax=Dyadobacter sp. TaxID=1914288 RepID=UPI003F6FD59A